MTSFEVLYYFLASLLVVAHCAALTATLFSLPGNWVIVALTAVFAWYPSQTDGLGVSWTVVASITLLAAVGEIVELFAGAAGAAKRGASRRAMILAVFGTFAGSLAGAAVCSAIPVIGLIVGAVLGGAFGAFGGAVAGELWKGRSSEGSLSVGRAAFLGRLTGTMSKLAIGAIMVAIVAVDAFFL